MKLCIQEKHFSLNTKFSVCDENGNPVYNVKGHMLSLGYKLPVFNLQDEEVAFVHQKVVSLKPKFFIEVDGKQVAEVDRKLSFHHNFEVKGPGWTVEGDISGHAYSIMSGSQTIATISNAWFTWGDTFLIDVVHDEDALLALCIVLCIDCINVEQKETEGDLGGGILEGVLGSH